jgi:hypothetical protein
MFSKRSNSERGYSKVISFPISLLKTTNTPIGKDNNIIPKSTDKSAAWGIPKI